MENDPRYHSQFRADFRVRKRHIMTWLCYLKANHPDYRYITISLDRLDTLPVDSDVSLSFPSIIDESIVVEESLVTSRSPPSEFSIDGP
jgi:hypothetical protein